MGNLFQDLRFGTRMMLKSPGFTLVAVLALALGIGANTAIFSVVNAVLLQPLPFEQPDKIVSLTEAINGVSGDESSVAYPNFLDVKEQTQSLEAVAAYVTRNLALTAGRERRLVPAVAATSSLFNVLRARPLSGRLLLPEDDAVGAPPVVLVGHGLWQQQYASSPRLVGSQIQLDGMSFTVVGIMPPGFQFPVGSHSELWIPLGTDSQAKLLSPQRGAHYLESIGRMRSDITLEQARADVQAISSRLKTQYPETNADSALKLASLRERLVGERRPMLLVLMSAVAFVLFIACANVANLMLARSMSRQREVAIRAALGAGRARLVQQFLTESVLLACIGGALGALVSLWGVDLLVATALSNVPRIDEVRVDATVLSVTLVVSVITGLLFGLAPAISASQPALHNALKEGAGRLSGTSRRHRAQGLLVVIQVAFALVLLASAGLMIKSVARLQAVDPGFKPEGVMTVNVPLPDSRYNLEDKIALLGRLLERMEGLPGVESVGLSSPLPFASASEVAGIEVEGAPSLPPKQDLTSNIYYVSPGYFKAMGIRFKSGRTFNPAEVQGVGVRAILVNESLARRLWPNEDPIGKRIQPTNRFPEWHEIIGVVADVKHQTLDSSAPIQIYVPYTEVFWPDATIVLRTPVAPSALSDSLRNIVRDADPELPVVDPIPMIARLSESSFGRRSVMFLLGLFAALALLLASIGIYGVISYSVSERTHEIGIRAALGCQSSAILGLVVGRGLQLVAVGIGIGLAGAFTATRLLSSLLYGVTATDPSTFALVPLVMFGVAAVASYLPARRAAKVDPMLALRAS